MRHAARMAAAVVAALMAVQASAGTWHDDFEGGDLSDWEQFTDPQGADDPTQGEWEERREGGIGIVTGEVHGPTLVSYLRLRPAGVDTNKWINYTVRARARMDSRIQDDEPAFFGFSLYDQWDPFNQLLCFARVQEGIAEVSIYTPTDWGVFRLNRVFEDNVWYELSATVETNAETGNDRITFIIDDDPLIVDWPTSVGSGGVGLTIGGGAFSFDHVIITGGTIPNGGAGASLSVSPSGNSAQLWAQLKQW